MAAGRGDGVQCGGAGALYIAGGLLRWQNTTKGAPGEEDFLSVSFLYNNDGGGWVGDLLYVFS